MTFVMITKHLVMTFVMITSSLQGVINSGK